MSSRTALYRFYDEHGDLLYVGISVTPWTRWKQHKGQKDWAEEVRTTEVDWFDSRPEAIQAEKEAIQLEEPRYNIQHSLLPRTAEAAPVPPLTILADCTACQRPIRGLGWVQIDLEAVQAAEDQLADHNGLFTAAELMALSFPEWEILHDECDEDPERRLYVMSLDDIRSLGGLLDTTAHLMEKPWLSVTNWSEILRRIVHGDGTGPLFIPQVHL